MMQTIAPLVCPLCPGRVAFDDEDSLKLHLCSRVHINCHPYECAVCRERFASQKMCRQHHSMSHRSHPFTLIRHEEQLEKKGTVEVLLQRARKVREGPAEAQGDFTTIGGSFAGSFHLVYPTAGFQPFPVNMLLPSPAQLAAQEALEGCSIDADGPDENKIEVEKRDWGCAKCDKEVAESYTARRQHIFEAHSAELEGGRVKAKQIKLKMAMGECFPEARVLNDLTCNRCEEELPIDGRVRNFCKRQLEHIESSHLEEDMGVRLACPVDDCPDRHVAKPTSSALLQHIKKAHGGVGGGLNRVSEFSYKAICLQAKEQLKQKKARYFPHLPRIVLPAARRLQRRADGERK